MGRPTLYASASRALRIFFASPATPRTPFTAGKSSSSPPPVSLPPAMPFAWKWPAAPFPCTTAIHPLQCSPGLPIHGTGSAPPRWCCMMRIILRGWNCHWWQRHECGIPSPQVAMSAVSKRYGSSHGARAHRSHHRQGRICQPDRSFRLRQVHLAQADLRPHRCHGSAASRSTA